ncbi:MULTISPECIES: putative leader peptide [unclassified Streptomyces]|uniref:putative leader peptide n=1 Tax=unclassified Streptomyces TaxID=2593676 RepID=UPI00380D35CE
MSAVVLEGALQAVRRLPGPYSAEVTIVPTANRVPATVSVPPRRIHRVHLYSRAHIDLQRVAGSLCSS